MKILIAAGGTGGHIWPALSFRDWIQRKGISAETLFLSGSRELEEELYASAGVAPWSFPLPGHPYGVRREPDLMIHRSCAITEGRLAGHQGFSPDICLCSGAMFRRRHGGLRQRLPFFCTSRMPGRAG